MVEKENHISVAFSAASLSRLVYIPNKNKRNNEVSIFYSIIKEHKIKVNFLTDWAIENEGFFVTSTGSYYKWKADYNRKQKVINLYYYLATQKDYITTNEYKQYIQDVKNVEQSTGYFIFVPENYSGTNIDSDVILDGIMNIFKFLLFLAIVIVVILLIFCYRSKIKKAI